MASITRPIMSDPAIAFVPYGMWKPFGMGKISLDDLNWPLGRPGRLSSGSIADLTPRDHLITFPSSKVFHFPWFGIKAQVSVIIVEPDILHQKNLDRALRRHKSFFAVLTKSDDLISKIPNGLFHYFGWTMIDDVSAITPEKTRMTSLIASAKDNLPGHQLRHRIVDYINAEGLDIEIMGRAYKPFEKKKDGLQSYMYSVVIENVQEPHYFTEKIVDAALCRTVPVYWGCLNIGDYFDAEGMIVCDTEEEMRQQLASITPEDYARRRDAIEENYRRALVHADHDGRAAKLVFDRIKQS